MLNWLWHLPGGCPLSSAAGRGAPREKGGRGGPAVLPVSLPRRGGCGAGVGGEAPLLRSPEPRRLVPGVRPFCHLAPRPPCILIFHYFLKEHDSTVPPRKSPDGPTAHTVFHLWVLIF